MPTLLDAITNNAQVKFFCVLDSGSDYPCDWEVEAIEADVLSDEAIHGDGKTYFVIKALNVAADGTIRECYVDLNLPERISDYAFILEDGVIRYGYYHQFPGEIIPASAIDCFGVYDQFYCRTCPQIGIDILKRGMEISRRKACIAQDLGYIFRDEGRFAEAAAAFKIVIEEGPSCEFIFAELAAAYARLGDSENERKYDDEYLRIIERNKKNRGWRGWRSLFC